MSAGRVPSIVKPLIETLPVVQMSTTSSFGCAPPSESHDVVLAGVAGPTTVTAPRALSLTPCVMTSCSSYVPPQTLMTAPEAAAAIAALIVLKPGLVQLLPTATIGAVDETQSGPVRPAFFTVALECVREIARVLPRPAGETCITAGRVAAVAPCADKARPARAAMGNA